MVMTLFAILLNLGFSHLSAGVAARIDPTAALQGE
jgi:hypothetical protein